MPPWVGQAWIQLKLLTKVVFDQLKNLRVQRVKDISNVLPKKIAHNREAK